MHDDLDDEWLSFWWKVPRGTFAAPADDEELTPDPWQDIGDPGA